MALRFGIGNYLSYKMTQGVYKKREDKIEKNERFYTEVIGQLIKLNQNLKL